MALPLTARQTRLVENNPLEPVYLHVLTTYTSKSASPRTVDKVYYWSDHPVLYDFGDTGVLKQFLPYIVSTTRQYRESMQHLQAGGALSAELLRTYKLTLRNVTPQGETNLLKDLRTHLLEFSTVVVAELLLDPAIVGGEEPSTLVGDEHVVLFRGEMNGQPKGVDTEQFTLDFRTERLEGLLGTPLFDTVSTTVAPRDLGKRVPVLYGDVKRVPLLGARVGPVTTLAVELSGELDTNQKIVLTDDAQFEITGAVMVGGEFITYGSRTGVELTSLARTGGLAIHTAGESVAFIPEEVVYALGEDVSNFSSVRLRHPTHGLLFAVPFGEFHMPDAEYPYYTMRYSRQDWRDLLFQAVKSIRMLTQARYDGSGTGSVVQKTISASGSSSLRGSTKDRIMRGLWDDNEFGRTNRQWDFSPLNFFASTKTMRHKFQASDKPSTNRAIVRGRPYVTCRLALFDDDTPGPGWPAVTLYSGTFLIDGQNFNDADPGHSLADEFAVTESRFAVLSFRTSATAFATDFGEWKDVNDRTVINDTDTIADLVEFRFEPFESHVFQGTAQQRQAASLRWSLLLFGFSYEYLDSVTEVGLLTDAEVEGLGGAAGVELYADVLGPVVPRVLSEAYGFNSDEPNWSDNDGVQSNQTTYQKLVSDAVATIRKDLLSDAANWVLAAAINAQKADASDNVLRLRNKNWTVLADCNADQANWAITTIGGALKADATIGGEACLQWQPAQNSNDSIHKTFGTALDLEFWQTLRFYFWIPAATDNISRIRISLHTVVNVDYTTWELNFDPRILQTDAWIFISGQINAAATDTVVQGTGFDPTSLKRIQFITTVENNTPNPSNIYIRDFEWYNPKDYFERSFAAENWSADECWGVDSRVLAVHGKQHQFLFYKIGSSATDFYEYRVDFLAGHALDQYTRDTFSLQDPTGDERYVRTVGSPSLAAVTHFSIAMQTVSWNQDTDTEFVYFKNLLTLNALGTPEMNNSSLGGVNMSCHEEHYPVTIRATGTAAFDSVVIYFTDEVTAIGVLPVERRIVTIPSTMLPDGELVTVGIDAVDIGTPTVASVNTINVQILGEIAPGDITIELHNMDRSDVDSTYKDLHGALIEHPADVVRHILRERLGVLTTQIDETAWALAETNLGSNLVSTILGELGNDFYSVLGRLGYEHRMQLLSEETATVTQYKLVSSKADYKWPTTSLPAIDEWEHPSENGRDGNAFATRWRVVYEPDRSSLLAGQADGFLAALRIDVTQNDISAEVATSLLTTAETRYGQRTAGGVVLQSIVDAETAKDVMGFYVSEIIRASGFEYVLLGVPARLAYALQRDDVRKFTPPWTGVEISGRLVGKTRHHGKGLKFDLTFVEVDVS